MNEYKPLLKNLAAFFVAFLLPIILFAVVVTDAHWFMPFIVCPACVAGAAWYTAGKEAKVTKWVMWGAIVGVVYAILIVALN